MLWHLLHTMVSCPISCTFFANEPGNRDEKHERHECDAVTCPLTCQLCKRLCATADHFHALGANAVHLCR
jgi:hypothetical protein